MGEDIKMHIQYLKRYKARMLYEARQAEISDQLTRIKSAEEKGIEKGIEKGATEKAIKVAEKMIIKGLSMDDIAEITELTVERLIEIKHNMVH